MKEQNLIDLNFKRTDVSAEESGQNAYYFYEHNLGLFTNDSDQLINKEWEVSIDFNDIKITDVNDLKLLIDVLERNEKK